MIELYMITGFLGAGKTTMLKHLIDIFSNRRLSVVINEFGKQGIDGSLIRSIGAYVDEINNGSIFCACRLDKFESVLAHHVELNPEIILVEASGLADPTSVKKVLSQFTDIHYAGCIALVDAVNFPKVMSTAKVCRRQIAISDLVIINKTDLADTAQIEQVESLIREQRPDVDIKKTTFGALESAWIDMLCPSNGDSVSGYHLKDVSLQKYLITISSDMELYQLVKFLSMFIEATYRIKGFVCLDGKIFLVDCAGIDVKVVPYTGETGAINQIVVLSGANMDTQKQIDHAVEWYKSYIVSVE